MTARRNKLFRTGAWSAAIIAEQDVPALQELFEQSQEYFELEFGLPPGPSEAHSTFIALPEGKHYEDKLLIGLFEADDILAGVLDVIRDYPAAGEWSIGLMLLHPSRRRQGVGSEVFSAFEKWAASQGARRIRIGVLEHNQQALRFFQRVGFDIIEKQPPKKFGVKESGVVVMQRILSPPRANMTCPPFLVQS
ncbi:MAG: GNAT family N-acetyltransferase [Armatimonadota bacterium]|nr:GNAT family N-acetyltransferase [Armatimonadota bacterium]MDR7450761.1 GNAT family N-acetyltransferase [Armatimonadota bacterium]MDR7466117.1 GNAT family N-acetyltransferase [Armatimonadota bacterium]MDR7493847.1 GNAT family N-acetyltransferase [Armatimonadota bacterium]MDR7498993.1 GNAT family N-acetyltransferase [Armatimonadota bacterium]